jgi:RHS repeat-associated protein
MPFSTTARYLHDGAGNRLLSQENVNDPADTRTDTLVYQQTAGSNRWNGSAPPDKVTYDAAGQPDAIGSRRLSWDAAGRLAAVRQGDNVIATYRYNHRGERVGKTVAGQQIRYLYENRQLVAELDAAGRIRRQYLYLADQPMAVIDTPDGAVIDSGERTFAGDLAEDLRTIWRALFTNTDKLTYLHGNHLGAIELATDSTGNPVWRGAYSAYGKVTPVTLPISAGGPASHPPFKLNLRFPGQYADAETGLVYNDHRYYDPDRGAYLTPDPLGLRGGINSYAYVANNPLKYVDPSGLILFAFDGSGNEETDPSLLSNVVRFRQLYQDGTPFYITGVGTRDPASGIGPAATDPGGAADLIRAYTGKARIAAMVKNLETYADGVADDTAIDIDITGFSRGAAEGRDFANQLVGKTTNGYYRYSDDAGGSHCQKVNFRFIGLFDTVLSEHTGDYALRIPDAFQYVAQAMALNEYRGNAIKFPFESILGVPVTNDRVRIERGFLGSHSDIGGGFLDQDLAKIAMTWMVNQATLAGVKMQALGTSDLTVIADPVIHDKSQNLLFGAPTGGPTSTSEDRQVRYADGTAARQRNVTTGFMIYNDTLPFIQYKADPNTRDSIAGTVDAKAYLQWLNDHHYDISMTTP